MELEMSTNMHVSGSVHWRRVKNVSESASLYCCVTNEKTVWVKQHLDSRARIHYSIFKLNIITNYKGVNKKNLEMKTSGVMLYAEYSNKCCEVFDKCFIIPLSGRRKAIPVHVFIPKNRAEMRILLIFAPLILGKMKCCFSRLLGWGTLGTSEVFGLLCFVAGRGCRQKL